jgi:hypothetical protein
MTRLDKGRDPHAKIKGIAATHDPPPALRSERMARPVGKGVFIWP